MDQMTVSSFVNEESQLSSTYIEVISRNIANTFIVHEPSRFYHISKRVIDILGSLVGLLVLIPVFLVIALLIKLDDGGKVLHFREIIGKNGRRFYALKFRTMIPDADTYLLKHPQLMKHYQQNMKLTNDPRITHIGKWLRRTSLDELPQLLNVLRGDMSLVGPRMIYPSELPRYHEWGQKRLTVKPGITGLWQIRRRHSGSYKERIVLDMQYIDERSLRSDLAILFKTFKVFIIHTGA